MKCHTVIWIPPLEGKKVQIFNVNKVTKFQVIFKLTQLNFTCMR